MNTNTLQIKHSGLMGDLIYSIPSILELMKKFKLEGVNIYIPNNKPSSENSSIKHIGGSLMFNHAMFDFIEPLLKEQEFIKEVFFVKEEEIPNNCVDFDIIRYGLINTGAGSIPSYYSKAFGLVIDHSKPWLHLNSKMKESPYKIIIGRSTRYINKSINYSLLSKLEYDLGFIGTEQEYKIFTKEFDCLRIKYLELQDARTAAHYISQSDLYIGNQSFLFSIAESMKVNRLIESFEPVPNVIPTGGKCGQFITTKGLYMQINQILKLQIEPQISLTPEYHLNHPLSSENH